MRTASPSPLRVPIGLGRFPAGPTVRETTHRAQRELPVTEDGYATTLQRAGVPAADLDLWCRVARLSSGERPTRPLHSLVRQLILGEGGPRLGYLDTPLPLPPSMWAMDAVAWLCVLPQTGLEHWDRAQAWQATSRHGWAFHAAGVTVAEVASTPGEDGWDAGRVRALAALRGVTLPTFTAAMATAGARQACARSAVRVATT